LPESGSCNVFFYFILGCMWRVPGFFFAFFGDVSHVEGAIHDFLKFEF